MGRGEEEDADFEGSSDEEQASDAELSGHSEYEEQPDTEDDDEGEGDEEGDEDGGGSGAGGGDGDDEQGLGEEPTQQQLEERRQQNIRALVSGSDLSLRRQALLPRLLTVQQVAVVLRKPFKSPHPSAPAVSEALKRKLAARKNFVPWGGGKFVPLKLKLPPRDHLLLPDDASLAAGGADSAAAATSAGPPPVVLPPGVEPLILWEPPPGVEGQAVRVDDQLTQFLRPHQREGVQFMFECVTGLRGFHGQGCILADDMGLGKTLQGISLLWTLLSSKGHPLLGGDPIARRVIICCPTSLVGNWDSECQKWLQGRVRTLPLCESSRDEALASIAQFLSPRNPYQVMIVSYETFRLHAERFTAEGTCDLLICDEAHRLKNDATLTNRALDSLACRRRVLLSGTPLQNRLDEFYAMVSFCNPGVLGSPAQFRRHFEAPILAGREPDASEAAVQLCQERTAELSALVNEFILRRTNTLLSQHLPPKVVEIVCCRLTPLQLALYCHFLESKATRSLFATQKAARVLSAITSLRKLLNHPKLIYDALHSAARCEDGGKEAEGFEGCGAFFPPGMFGSGRTGRSGMPPGWELLSGKFAVLAGMLELLRTCTRDRIVIVSNYTQTLDLVGQLCRDRGYPYVRLDGTTTIKKRNKLVKDFNDPSQKQFAFLLSSKAGGCGLNLIGGNRLVLFDPSWNPADDKQAAARVWRDGQQKKVYVYRFMATGTIEEKVYQRQLSKEGLQQVVDSKASGKAGPNLMSMDELRDLFSYDPHTLSTTYDSMCCDRPPHPQPHHHTDGNGAEGSGAGGRRGGGSGGRGRGGKGGRGGGGGRGRGRGRGRGGGRGGGRGSARKRRRRAQGWSSSEEEESEEEESEDEDDEVLVERKVAERQVDVPDSEDDEELVIVDDSEEEQEQEQRQQQQPQQSEQHQRRQQRQVRSGSCGDDSDSDGWSSEEGGQDKEERERQQGPAQPLPPTQQMEADEGEAAAAAAAGSSAAQAPPQGQPQAAGGAGDTAGGAEQQQQLVPSAAVVAAGGTIHKEQAGKPGEEQLRLWGHHSSTATVPDQVMRQLGDEHVSFVFSLQVDGKAIDPEPPLVPLSQQQQQQRGAVGVGLGGGAGGLGARQQRRPAVAGAVAAGPAAVAAGKPASALDAAGTVVAAPVPAAAAAAQPAGMPSRQQAAPRAAQAPPVAKQPPVAAPAAKENAGGNAPAVAAAATAASGHGSRLSLAKHRPHGHNASSGAAPAAGFVAGAAAGVKRPAGSAGLAAAVQRVAALSDSDDDDFK